MPDQVTLSLMAITMGSHCMVTQLLEMAKALREFNTAVMLRLSHEAIAIAGFLTYRSSTAIRVFDLSAEMNAR